MGGFRLGFENACAELGFETKCVFTSEIKPHALDNYLSNFPGSEITGDITKVDACEIPDFDVLLAGFPCQAFSAAGKREGFADTRGTLFFEIERILKEKKPKAFILENVEGLVTHDRARPKDPMGRTLQTILEKLNELGYRVSWKVLNAVDFGVPQKRKRIFIVGTLENEVSLVGFNKVEARLLKVIKYGQPVVDTKLSRLLTKSFTQKELEGKAVKDKRGGKDNIHSWDIGLKGKVSAAQKGLLEAMLRARRNKKWAELKGIEWMDGMPLTLSEIETFYDVPKLKELLDDLVQKGYLAFEHPKDITTVVRNGQVRKIREPRTTIEKGYNIVTGKLSFDINVILNPKSVAPTLVATDLSRICVSDRDGLRPLIDLELLRLFGFPDKYKLLGSSTEKADLIGNTVVVTVVNAVTKRLVESVFKGIDHSSSVHKSSTERQMTLFESEL
jgi:DNA (cytosine-5)-methyltransferase 1